MSDIGALTNTLVADARRGDHILIMSNGAFGGIHQRVLDQLRRAHSHQG
jgi:UDP-N-acetylmuramate: L-alanyl-gamma-D-glutamyl-meso-diaminopimelate ligase